MKVKIEIDTKTFVRFWLVVIGFGLALFALYSARTALTLIGAAVFLALALNPPVHYIAKHLPGKSRVGGTLLAFLSVIIALGAFVVLVIPPIVTQTSKFISTVPSLVENVTQQSQGIRDFIENNSAVKEQVNAGIESLKNNASGMAANISGTLINSTGALANGLFSLILVLVMTVLMLIEGPDMLRSIKGLYRNKTMRDNHQKIATRMYRVIVGYVNGQITIAMIAGLFSGLAVATLSLFIPQVAISLAIPVAALIFIGTMIPLFGATLSAIVVGLLLLISSWWAALIYIIYFLIYQQIENNVVAPHIQSKKIDISALAIIIAVTSGIYIFGIVGAIISIPVAGCIRVLLDDYIEKRNEDKPEPKKQPLHTQLISKLKKKKTTEPS